MSKRRLERELEELSIDVLSELSAEDRLQMFLEGAATDNEAWLAQLRDNTPKQEFRANDRAFADRGVMAIDLAQILVYELHTTSLRIGLLRQQQHLISLLRAIDVDPPAGHDAVETDITNMLGALEVRLYVTYHAARRFATEVLGVDLGTWVGLHPDGAEVLGRLAEDLAGESLHELAAAHLRSGDEVDDLEAAADAHYASLVETWEAQLA